MMSIVGWYYLHENGSLIYKSDYPGVQADLRESPFVRSLWPCDPERRELAWDTLVEASALGADAGRVAELAEKWGCTDADAATYAERIGVDLRRDGSAWQANLPDFVNLMESHAGFGETCLAALADLCQRLGFKGRRTWTPTFADLVKSPLAEP